MPSDYAADVPKEWWAQAHSPRARAENGDPDGRRFSEGTSFGAASKCNPINHPSSVSFFALSFFLGGVPTILTPHLVWHGAPSR